MCKISNKIFNLKEGFIEPHRVEILLSLIYGKCYARIMVGNDKQQKLTLLPLENDYPECPCASQTAAASNCASILFNKDRQKKLRIVNWEL